jgi:uncharacterized membrane protein
LKIEPTTRNFTIEVKRMNIDVMTTVGIVSSSSIEWDGTLTNATKKKHSSACGIAKERLLEQDVS